MYSLIPFVLFVLSYIFATSFRGEFYAIGLAARLFVPLILSSILVPCCLYKKMKNNNKNMVGSIREGEGSNPIDLIKHNGTLGILLGYDWDMVVSKCRHLKIMTDEELDEINGILHEVYLNRFTTARDVFDDIKSISFVFKQGKLNSIFIDIESSTPNVSNKEIYSIIGNRLKTKLGIPYYESEDSLVWYKGNNRISYGKYYIDSFNKECISIVIEDLSRGIMTL